jgi:hypothetical protein
MVWGAHYTLGARYLYIKRNVEKVWGVRYLPENTVILHQVPVRSTNGASWQTILTH